MSTVFTRASRFVSTAALLIAVGLVATACLAEPLDARSSSPSASVPENDDSQAPAQVAPDPVATEALASGDITVPTDCAELYSDAALATLDAEMSPLNDPVISLYSTQIVGALEILESGAPTLRCTWGNGTGAGLATNVTIVTADQASAVISALSSQGMTCAEQADGLVCEAETTTIDLDGNEVSRGESHYLRGNGWVATSWVGLLPEDYTPGIAGQLWS